MTPPEFRDLIGDDVPEQERERLRRVHELLVAAGPPPDLPPRLAEPPSAATAGSVLPRRRWGVLGLAAALAAATLIGGYLVGYERASFDIEFTVQMHGTPAAPQALASIEVGERDPSGNWPMLLKVRGLKQLPEGAYYELFLARNGRPAVSCGTFRVHAGTTSVRLNAPYRFKRFDGWVVTAHVPGRAGPAEILLTTY